MKKMMPIMIGLLLAITSLSSWAAYTCVPMAGYPRVDTVQLSPPSISAGADIPLGTIIYQGQWQSGETFARTVMCTTPIADTLWFNIGVFIRDAPLPLSNWSGSPFGGAVYQTAIPGIGVVITRRDNSMAATMGSPIIAFTTDQSYVTASAGEQPILMANNKLNVLLIKTGQISPGSYTINASTLPTFGIDVINPISHAAVAGLPVQQNTIKLVGQLTVSTQTCTTPDVAVTLGSYEISKYFKGISSVTPWIDASISLTNCPVFHGFYDQNNLTTIFNYDTGTGSVATSTNNKIGVRLTPVGNVMDATNGIMEINSTVPGAASGVGIQIGWGSSSQTPTPFNFAAEQSVILTKDGSSTIRVPLAARYIQTNAAPTPGKADGKLTFTINYY